MGTGGAGSACQLCCTNFGSFFWVKHTGEVHRFQSHEVAAMELLRAVSVPAWPACHSRCSNLL